MVRLSTASLLLLLPSITSGFALPPSNVVTTSKPAFVKTTTQMDAAPTLFIY